MIINNWDSQTDASFHRNELFFLVSGEVCSSEAHIPHLPQLLSSDSAAHILSERERQRRKRINPRHLGINFTQFLRTRFFLFLSPRLFFCLFGSRCFLRRWTKNYYVVYCGSWSEGAPDGEFFSVILLWIFSGTLISENSYYKKF